MRHVSNTYTCIFTKNTETYKANRISIMNMYSIKPSKIEKVHELIIYSIMPIQLRFSFYEYLNIIYTLRVSFFKVLILYHLSSQLFTSLIS